MASNLRTIIDFATGDNWEMPLELYERFQVEWVKFSSDGQTIIQQWISSLPQADKEKIVRK